MSSAVFLASSSHSPHVSGQPTSTSIRRLRVVIDRLSSLPSILITASKLRIRNCSPTAFGVTTQAQRVGSFSEIHCSVGVVGDMSNAKPPDNRQHPAVRARYGLTA